MAHILNLMAGTKRSRSYIYDIGTLDGANTGENTDGMRRSANSDWVPSLSMGKYSLILFPPGVGNPWYYDFKETEVYENLLIPGSTIKREDYNEEFIKAYRDLMTGWDKPETTQPGQALPRFRP